MLTSLTCLRTEVNLADIEPSVNLDRNVILADFYSQLLSARLTLATLRVILNPV